METYDESFHSVSKVLLEQPGFWLSNCLFTVHSPKDAPFEHVTTFTGRPEEPLKRALLKPTDDVVLNALGRSVPALTQRPKNGVKGADE